MEILLSYRGEAVIPMTCLPAVLWGPDLSWALAALPIKITVIIKANVTGMRTASQVTQQNPSNCRRLQGRHNCLMQWCWAGCCNAVPLHQQGSPVLSCSLPAPSLLGCLSQSSPLPLPEHLWLHVLPLPKSHFCVKTGLSLFPISLLFFPPLMCSRVPTQPGPVRQLSCPSLGAFPHTASCCSFKLNCSPRYWGKWSH